MLKSTFGRTLAALVMLLALAGTTSLMAQTRAKIGVGGGGTLALGDFGDAFKTGWHGQVMAVFDLPAFPVDIRVDGQYGEHKDDITGDVKTKLITGMVGAQVPLGPPGSPAKPYLTAGVGVTNIDVSVGSVSASTTEFAIGGGGGVTFSLGSVSLFIEARFMNAFTDGGSTTFIPITGGILFGGK
ncbi:MAG: outer membrane beta-barrel protein [Gemmatimonadales bacterium]|nr:outer membrane beta-barrel protein [Gemmatimonadales bacterium]